MLHVIVRYISTDNAIFLETKIVHGLINSFLNFLPVRSSLDKLVDILGDVRLHRARRRTYEPLVDTLHRTG